MPSFSNTPKTLYNRLCASLTTAGFANAPRMEKFSGVQFQDVTS